LVNNFILVGASSEFANSYIKKCKEHKYNIYCISRSFISEVSKSNQLVVTDYLKESDKIIKFIDQIDNSYVIFFNGYLAENRKKQYPNFEEIKKTIFINYSIPLTITKHLSKSKKINKFIYISSMAAVKFRYKNYYYGFSKKILEESVKAIHGIKFLIIRYGQIHTRMSYGHTAPPFSFDPEKASEILLKSIEKEGIIYPNYKLLIMALLIQFIPIKFIDLIEQRMSS